MEQWEWTVIRGVCITPGADGVATYGVQGTCAHGVWQWPDVDLDYGVAAALAQRLNALQPAPCHFTDMVLDYIEERARAGL